MAHPRISKTSLVAPGGARPTLYAATEPLPGATFVGPSGFKQLRGGGKPVTGSTASRDAVLAARLWERSIDLTGVDVLATGRAHT